MFEYAADVSGPVPLPMDGMVEQLPIVTELAPELEEQLTHNRAQLRRMGADQPRCESGVRAGKRTLRVHEDAGRRLAQSPTDLKQVVAELDEMTKQEFVKTFDAVDKQFRETSCVCSAAARRDWH
jgi:chromosome segregation protein